MNAIAITDHAKDRYAEKIMGITEHNTRKQYLAMNDKKIVADITKLITHVVAYFCVCHLACIGV